MIPYNLCSLLQLVESMLNENLSLSSSDSQSDTQVLQSQLYIGEGSIQYS